MLTFSRKTCTLTLQYRADNNDNLFGSPIPVLGIDS